MVHYSKVINGIVEYVDKDLVAKMNGSWKAWCIGTVVALAASKSESMFSTVREHPIVKSLGLIDGEMVDVDPIYSELLKQANKRTATVDIPIVGSVTYSAADVENLYRLIVC